MVLSADAYAKINLTLDVAGKRDDGYHLLRMVMQSVSLCDRVTLEDSEGDEIRVRCDKEELPCNEDNTVFRAARAFFAAAGDPSRGVSFSIEKRIPWQAGLGGGNADAAAALKLLNRRFSAGFSLEKLCKIGLSIGADVPFCVVGGTALVEGIGERLTPVSSLPDCFLVLCKPPVGNNTKAAFARLDASGGQAPAFTDPMLEALKTGDLLKIAVCVGNAFETTVPFEEGEKIKRMMKSSGALGAGLSGSGSALYGIFAGEETASACVERLAPLYKDVFLCRPVPTESML